MWWEKRDFLIYNIGNNHPEIFLDFVTILKEELLHARVLPKDYDFEAHKKLVPMQSGDVSVTYADMWEIERFSFKLTTGLRDGSRKFVQ